MSRVGLRRLGCLISGGGRTVLNLHAAIERGEVPASIEVVVAHREDVAGVARCRDAGLQVEVVPVSPDTTTSERVDQILDRVGVELVCLCGYLRHFRVAPRWSDRVVNIHPSLLPRHGGRGMYGDRVHAAVLAQGDTESGCTVHAVDEIYDHGAMILQRRCGVEPDDTTASLAARVFAAECQAMPEAIRALAEGRIRIADGRVLTEHGSTTTDS
ncbi:MAG: formyltransferase family protein [Planctomycetota bacterium]|nr:formyltransferase family protein [Planctomycetota bacterium]MDA1025504.1 formyltransferase family protein [Planctomycetota bacterium]